MTASNQPVEQVLVHAEDRIDFFAQFLLSAKSDRRWPLFVEPMTSLNRLCRPSDFAGFDRVERDREIVPDEIQIRRVLPALNTLVGGEYLRGATSTILRVESRGLTEWLEKVGTRSSSAPSAIEHQRFMLDMFERFGALPVLLSDRSLAFVVTSPPTEVSTDLESRIADYSPDSLAESGVREFTKDIWYFIWL